MQAFWRVAFQSRIVVNAIKIALVVGTILNIANQGNALLDGSGISWPHLLLNYFIPYCVATWSAARNEMSRPDANPISR